MTSITLAQNFEQYFQVIFASNQHLREESFRIRHAVYSEELGWEPVRESSQETDECDDYSFALLLLHKRTGQYAGTARLVIPPPSAQHLKLPFEKHVLDKITTNVIDFDALTRGSFSEISRLAVPEVFRRRLGEQNVPFVINDLNPVSDVFSDEERRNFPNIAIGLYLGVIAFADLCNHDSMYVVVEPRLKRRLERLGFLFEQVGEELEYHGVRALYYLPRTKFIAHLNPEIRELYQMLRKQLEAQMYFYPYHNGWNK
jgi:N-acyl amino acid synthase of PEP-CTERM/exosortase system